MAPAAAPDGKPPRFVAAAMLDVDGDSLADRVRLTYSERVRHIVDRDGRYPFTVSGYRIRSVGKASGKALVVVLVEHGQPDPAATPRVRYRRTKAQPVRDVAGNQALGQLFARTKAHGHLPAGTTPAPSPTPTPTPTDTDGDGTVDTADCAPKNAAIHPGAADVPDLEFVDSNCDGIDGTERDAVFAASNGNDANPGTKARPKRQIQAALQAAVTDKKPYVLVAFGTYEGVSLASRVSIYGGYDPQSWARRDRFPGPGENGLPSVRGTGQGVLSDGAKDVVLQHLSIEGAAGGGAGASAYGIRAIGGSGLPPQ